jgi:hypothetical protein
MLQSYFTALRWEHAEMLQNGSVYYSRVVEQTWWLCLYSIILFGEYVIHLQYFICPSLCRMNMISELRFGYFHKIHIYMNAYILLFPPYFFLIVYQSYKLRVFENRFLRRIFGPKRDKVRGGWRKLHNEELHNLYSSPSIIKIIKSRRIRWTGYVERMGESRNTYRIFVGKPREKRPQGRPRRRWVANIKIYLREI